MNNEKVKKEKQLRRHRRVRAKISGTASIPRMSVSRSNREMYVQLIDDAVGKTLVSAHSREIKKKAGNKTDVAFALGKLIGEKAKAKKIKTIVFDRGGYKYHGRIKSVADGARESGLQF